LPYSFEIAQEAGFLRIKPEAEYYLPEEIEMDL